MGLPAIIFDDETMVAFDKPCGLPVVPNRLNIASENLMGMVHVKYGQQVASAHRLETDMSGVFICAKTKVALDFLSGQFQSKTVDKRHLALVVFLPVERAMKFPTPVVPRLADGGMPDNFTVDLPLGEDQHQQGRMRVFRKHGGKPSVTEFRVLERFGSFALMECRPLSSSLHQIRVHLAAAGAPVLNDSFYGDPEVQLLLSGLKRHYKGRDDEKPLITRLALHASEFTLKHPTTREPVTIRAELPHEFEVALKYLRKFSVAPRR
jgi:RluA family pseudouridine synthase